jgi:hypothetical protein
MEPRFERDFRHVRIHTDAQAAESADAVHADAYTVGHHIVFSDGQYSGASWKSRQLLQHELVHTIQQSHVSDEHIRAAEGKLEIGDSHGPLEREARAHDAETEMTREVGAGGSNALLQRQAKDDPKPGTEASDGPAAYDGCHDQRAIASARGEAQQAVAHAVDVLEGENVKAVAQLLEAHFHLDLKHPDAEQNLNLIRGQLKRMSSALGSGIRIFCRSAPRVSGSSPSPTMPIADACRRDRANSTSCAAGDSSATVVLCESALAETSEAPLTKTIIHEFAHVACNGNPPIQSGGPAGGEKYYDGTRLPDAQPNVLNQADSYAWFALKAGDVGVASAANTGQTPAPSSGRSKWWALIGLAAALGIGGIWAHGLWAGAVLAAAIGIAGLAGAFDPKPMPTAIRLVKVHQLPMSEAGVESGYKSGFGGVSEIEVSKGDTDYDGEEIKEQFVGGNCQTANKTGQGGSAGSTFTVGRRFSNAELNLPAKRNTFYDQHIFADKGKNILPAGVNHQVQVCEQQYLYGGQVIGSKTFFNRYDAQRVNIAGQDVASITLTVTEKTSAQVPPASGSPGNSNAPATAKPPEAPPNPAGAATNTEGTK